MEDKEANIKAAFAEAFAESDLPAKAQQIKTSGIATIELTKWASITCLIGSTLPSILAYRFFGISSATFLILFTITVIAYRNHLPRAKIKQSIATIGLVLVLTGCSGLSSLLASDPIPLVVAKNPGKEYKSGYVQQLGVFGMGLDKVSEETAMQNGNIEKAYATQTTRSFGWISVARVRVYGE